MTTLALAGFIPYDVALDGVGLLVDWANESQFAEHRPYRILAPDLIVERTDQDEQITNNKLDSLYYGGNRSWHKGQGQQRADMPNESDPYKFLSSLGVDITVPGQLTLLPAMSRVLAEDIQAPAPMKMVATDTHLWVAGTAPDITRISALDGSDAVVQSVQGADASPLPILDLATDGAEVYVALGSGGTHRSVTPATTQREAFDSGAYTDTGVTSSYDTDDKKQGTGSRKVVSTAATTGTASKTVSLDLLAANQFKVWVKASRAMAAGEVRLRFGLSATKYFECSFPALAANTWYENLSDRVSSYTLNGGAVNADWAAITSIVLVVPGLAAPTYRSSSSVVGTTTYPSPTGQHNERITVGRPSGVVAGDVLIASLLSAVTEGVSITHTPPSGGWTLIRSDSDTTPTDYDRRLSTYYRVALAGEPSGYTFTAQPGGLGNTAGNVLVVSAYSGVDPAAPINASAGNVNASSTNLTAPSVTTTLANTRVLSVLTQYSFGHAIGSPAGFTSRREEDFATQTPAAIEHNDKVFAAAAATGTIVGSVTPASRSICHTIALAPLTVTARFDDLRSIVVSAFAHYSDADARVFGYVKDALYAAGVKSTTSGVDTWRFFLVGSGAGSTEIFVLPAGWAVTDITELGGIIYFSAYRGNRSQVYAYDGTNTPFIALPIDAIGRGTIVLTIIPFAGAGLLLGCRTATAFPLSAIGDGTLLRAFPNGAGYLLAEPVLTIPCDGEADCGIVAGFSYGNAAYFSWNDADAVGLGIYVPKTGAIARHLYAVPVGGGSIVASALSFAGRTIFSIDGDGVYIEQTSLVESGHALSSVIDVNIAADKLWLLQESTYLLVSDDLVTHDYSLDGGVTFDGVATSNDMSKQLRSAVAVKSPIAQVRATLYRAAADATLGPTLYHSIIGGWPARRPQKVHELLLNAFPDSQLRTGEVRQGDTAGVDLLLALFALWADPDVLDYQPPWWTSDTDTIPVRIAGVDAVGPWGTSGARQGGLIRLQLKEAGV